MPNWTRSSDCQSFSFTERKKERLHKLKSDSASFSTHAMRSPTRTRRLNRLSAAEQACWQLRTETCAPLTMYALALTAILLLSIPSDVHPSAAARYPIPFQRSILNQGDEKMLNRVFDKLERQECLDVVALGGSVTCGASLAIGETFFPDAPRDNRSYTWPAFLEMHLNEQHPCKARDGTASKHRVHNACWSGSGTDAWVELLSGSTRYQPRWDGRGINNTDLVVVDTAMNDVDEMTHKLEAEGGHVSDVAEAIQRSTESLMVLLLHNETADSTPPTPALRSDSIYGDLPLNVTRGRSWSWSGIACIWFGVGQRAWRPVNLWDGTWPRQGDSVHIHLPMAQRHGVPYVSMIDGFGPFTTLESQNWYWNVYRGDWCCHVSIQGHMLLGELLFNFVETRLEDRRQRATTRPWPYAGSDAHAPYQIRKPAKLSSWDVVRLMYSVPLRVEMQGDHHAIEPLNTTAVPCSGFIFGDDGHHKPGLLSSASGSTCHFLIPNEKVQKHLLLWQIHIKLLKSYNNTGMLGVQVSTVDCNVDQGITNQQALGSMEEACHWEKHFSLATVVQMEIKKPDAVSDSTCLLVTFNNLPWTNPALTKVKVYDFVLF